MGEKSPFGDVPKPLTSNAHERRVAWLKEQKRKREEERKQK